MTEHEKKYWSGGEFGTSIYNENGMNVASTAVYSVGHGFEKCKETARRIVACVNACDGISTDRLGKLLGATAHKSVIMLTTDNIDLKQQRDELVKALLAYPTHGEHFLENLQATELRNIALAKAGQYEGVP